MDAQEFKTRMLEMLPGADPAAMQNWISYASELEQEDVYPSEDFIDSDDFFDEVYVEFSLVKKHDGHDIARQIFDTSLSFSLNPFDIRGAARLLKGVQRRQISAKRPSTGSADRQNVNCWSRTMRWTSWKTRIPAKEGRRNDRIRECGSKACGTGHIHGHDLLIGQEARPHRTGCASFVRLRTS